MTTIPIKHRDMPNDYASTAEEDELVFHLSARWRYCPEIILLDASLLSPFTRYCNLCKGSKCFGI